jgi:hypothetical protein
MRDKYWIILLDVEYKVFKSVHLSFPAGTMKKGGKRTFFSVRKRTNFGFHRTRKLAAARRSVWRWWRWWRWWLREFWSA